MSEELISVLIAVLAIGATLAGLILTGNRGLRQDIRQDMARLETRLDERISGLESRFDGLERHVWRTARAHGAPGRAAGRITRGHHRAGQGQLGTRAA